MRYHARLLLYELRLVRGIGGEDTEGSAMPTVVVVEPDGAWLSIRTPGLSADWHHWVNQLEHCHSRQHVNTYRVAPGCTMRALFSLICYEPMYIARHQRQRHQS